MINGVASDARSGVMPPDAPGDGASRRKTVTVDQVIFASLPGLMGHGYRIVAASAGVQSQEKTEINRRSPSHASMCEADPQSVGLSTYPLATGRCAVACSTYGPAEYSSRGGRRIDTRIVLLDVEGYRRFDCNPLRVYRALADAVGPEPIARAPISLPRLALAPHASRAGDAVTLPPCFDPETDDARLAYLGSVLLAGERLIVRHVDAVLSLLEWAVMTVPLSRRGGLSLCAGLKLSPSRPSHLTILSQASGETERAIAGHNIAVYDGTHPPPPPASAYDEWLSLIRYWWSAGRFSEISRLTARLDAHDSPKDLSRVAQLCRDLDETRHAGDERRRQLFDIYRDRTGPNQVETELIERIASVTKPPPEPEEAGSREPRATAPAS